MTQLAADDFDRADGGLGANWAGVTSEQPILISSNEAICTAVSISGARYTAVAAPNDGYAEIVVGSLIDDTSDEGIGPAYRISTSSQVHYLVQTNQVETRLYRVNSGSYFQLGADGPACVTGDVLRLTCNGTSISVQRNGTTIIGPVADANIASGQAGIWAAGNTNIGTAASWAMGDLNVAAPTSDESYLASRRNRPGRGPYSLGRYFRQRIDAFTSLIGSVFSDTISETASAADSVSSTVAYSATIAESASAADSLAATLAAVAAIAETGTIADSINAALAATAAISETGDAQFAPTTGAAISAAIVETAAAADSVASALNAAAALAESGAAADSYSAIASLVAGLAESMNATDSVSWGGAVYSADIAEAANATNTLTAAVNALAALAESGNATDTVSALATLQATLAEAGSALDTLTVSGVYGVSVSETGDITFTVSVDSGILPGTPSRSVTVRAANRTITVRAANRTARVH